MVEPTFAGVGSPASAATGGVMIGSKMPRCCSRANSWMPCTPVLQCTVFHGDGLPLVCGLVGRQLQRQLLVAVGQIGLRTGVLFDQLVARVLDFIILQQKLNAARNGLGLVAEEQFAAERHEGV